MQSDELEVGAVSEPLDHLGADVSGGDLEDADGSVS
jgi:hypothetical protein